MKRIQQRGFCIVQVGRGSEAYPGCIKAVLIVLEQVVEATRETEIWAFF